jgi:hypothetical protein
MALHIKKEISMKSKLLGTCLLLGATSLVNVANAGLIDLSSWEHDGQGTWAVQGANNDSVYQSVNGQPTIFFNDGSMARDTAISGEITVQTTGDDDFIGFVLGYSNDELTSGFADYWLIDWKQGNQGAASRGLALSHVSAGVATADFWGHGSSVNEVARGTTLGDLGWGDNTKYTFDIVHTASLIQVSVNGNIEMSVSAADAGVAEFNDGAYGFYNYSQSNVLYSGLEERIVTSVPEPTTFAIFALGLIGLTSRRLSKK